MLSSMHGHSLHLFLKKKKDSRANANCPPSGVPVKPPAAEIKHAAVTPTDPNEKIMRMNTPVVPIATANANANAAAPNATPSAAPPAAPPAKATANAAPPANTSTIAVPASVMPVKESKHEEEKITPLTAAELQTLITAMQEIWFILALPFRTDNEFRAAWFEKGSGEPYKALVQQFGAQLSKWLNEQVFSEYKSAIYGRDETSYPLRNNPSQIRNFLQRYPQIARFFFTEFCGANAQLYLQLDADYRRICTDIGAKGAPPQQIIFKAMQEEKEKRGKEKSDTEKKEKKEAKRVPNQEMPNVKRSPTVTFWKSGMWVRVKANSYQEGLNILEQRAKQAQLSVDQYVNSLAKRNG